MGSNSSQPWYRRWRVVAGISVATLALGGVGVASATSGHAPRRPVVNPAPALKVVPLVPAHRTQIVSSRPATRPQTPAHPAARAQTPALAASVPAAQRTNAATNEPESATEAGSATDTGVDCENGLVKGTSTPCDGGPAANPTDNSPDQAAEINS
jgi:hypothetical protein